MINNKLENMKNENEKIKDKIINDKTINQEIKKRILIIQEKCFKQEIEILNKIFFLPSVPNYPQYMFDCL